MPRRPATLLFLALTFLVPLGQAGWERARGARVQALDLLHGAPSAARLREYEDALRRASFVRSALVPLYDRALHALFGRGNEKVLWTSDDRAYYSEDLDYVTRRSHVARAAAAAVVDLRDQLAARGVALLMVPVEPKAVAEWAPLGAPARPDPPAGRLFRAALEEAGVPFVDAPDDPTYLPRDTHWTPETMRSVARSTALRARELLADEPRPRVPWQEEQELVRGDGDLLRMLSFETGAPRTEVVVDRVTDGSRGSLFHAERDAEVLLLGDSFTRIYGDPELGFGAAAGFDAQLARELGAALDVIAIAGGGARTVREALARRPAGVRGKRLVVWQFSLRDLVADAARWAPLALDAAPTAAPLDDGERVVEARLVERSVPPPDFDYATLLAVHEYRVLRSLSGPPTEETVWVAHLVLRERAETPAAGYAVGAVQRLSLVPIEERYDLERTSWVDDTGAGPRIWFADEVVDVADAR